MRWDWKTTGSSQAMPSQARSAKTADELRPRAALIDVLDAHQEPTAAGPRRSWPIERG